jgi:hypothetical protein
MESIGYEAAPRQSAEKYDDTASSTCGYGGSCRSAEYLDHTGVERAHTEFFGSHTSA